MYLLPRGPDAERVDVYQIHGNRQLTQLARRLICRRCKKKEAKVTVLDPVWPYQATEQK